MLIPLEQKIISMYDDINLGNCDICRQCRIENPDLYSKAVGLWFVGNCYEQQSKKVLFVGKNARGVPAIEFDENQNDKCYLNEFNFSREQLWDKSWAYWSYTKDICNQLFGENIGMEAVAFTNMVKCNASDSTDTTTNSMKNYCINNLKVIRKEIEIIKPTHIVFYIGNFYNNWLNGIFDECNCILSKNIPIGNKEMPFAEYDCKVENNSIRALRVGHPERMKKDDYVSTIVKWIRS